MGGEGAPFDVFLSHAWRDTDPDRTSARPERGLVRHLRDRLEAASLRVFHWASL